MNQADQDRRIDYIEFRAVDLPATKAFFAGVFGWEFTDYGAEYTSFDDGRLSGGFTTSEPVIVGGVLVVLYAVDLEAVELRIVASGGVVTKPTYSFPGGRRLHFRDPNGNELAVWSDQE